MENSEHVTRAIMEGELTSLTVLAANDEQEFVVYAPVGPLTTRAIAALRLAYPTNRIVENGQRPGVVVHAVQSLHGLNALYPSDSQ